MNIVSGAAYCAFYRLFKNSVLQKEFKGSLPSYIADDSPTFWDKLGEERFSARFRGSDVTAVDYFHRKYNHFKNFDEGPIDDEGFSKALRYLYDVPETKTVHPKEWEGIAILFWRRFQKDYKSEIDKERRLRKKGKKVDAPDPQFEEVSWTVMNFYYSLRDQDFPAAWGLLSSDFQNRKSTWGGDFQLFKDGYVNTVKITEIKVLDHKQTHPNIIECLVLYLDHISAYTSHELSNLRDLKVKDIDTFCERVKTLTKHLTANGLEDFPEKVELYKLFECAVTDYIAFRCNHQYDLLPQLFNSKQRCEVRRAFNCECKLENSAWKIHRLIGVPFTNLR